MAKKTPYDSEDLDEYALNRVSEIEADASSRLEKLYNERYITNKDFLLLKDEISTRRQSVIQTLKSPDYDRPDVRKELIRRLIDRYETVLNEKIIGIEAKKYSPEKIKDRIKSIHEKLWLDFEQRYKRKEFSNKDYDLYHRFLSESDLKLFESIQKLSRKHPNIDSQIETWLKDYQQKSNTFLESISSYEQKSEIDHVIEGIVVEEDKTKFKLFKK